MKIVKVKGGMGNQMFQYAFMRYLQIVFKQTDTKADFSYYSQCKEDKIRIPRIMEMNTICDAASEAELKKILGSVPRGNVLGMKYRIQIALQAKLNKKYFFENNRAYREAEKLLKYDYFDGYWQSWRYLEPIRKELLAEFKPRTQLSKKTQNVISQLHSCNSVFVGIRRGDYAAEKSHYGECEVEYYRKALELLCRKIENPVFVFFSNDIEWVKIHMSPSVLGIEKMEILYRTEEEIENDFEELFVMAACKHAIIANSTFNFWGAWLITNPDKVVIAPRDWFKDDKPIDIVPDEWIKI